MYTDHGLQIPGTTSTSPRAKRITKCEGLYGCFQCYGQARNATRVMVSDDHQLLEVSFMDKLELPVKAKLIVANYYNDHKDDQADDITLKEIHIVWFSKTLKNWKALVTTDIPDNVYYEVTYNGEITAAYLDVYKKTENLVIQDKKD